MAKVFYRLLSVAMALLVLFSTMSFSISMHYCGGRLVETSFFHSTKGCGMEMGISASEKCSIVQEDCCKDENFVYEGQDQLQLSVDKIIFQDFTLFLPHTSPIVIYDVVYKESLLYEEYDPPLILKPIYKIDETYLI